MSNYTSIQWCDGAVNPVMGCDGCELWMPDRGVEICYAGVLHKMRGPLVALGKTKGYAKEFLSPEMFAGRMAAAAKWSDLRGKPRAEKRDGKGKIVQDAKPWMDGRARHTFISDMGDALSASIPFTYLRDEVIFTVARRAWQERGHIGMWLTKQPQRMAEFAAWLAADGIEWPALLWAGTSITGPGQGARVRALRKVPAAVRFLSIEPILRDPGEIDFTGIHLVIMGGQSGRGAGPTHVDDIRRLVERVRKAGAAPFVKQLGAHVITTNCDGLSGCDMGDWNLRDPIEQVEHDLDGTRDGYQGAPVRVHLDDRAGGDWNEWPKDLRVREWPRV